MSYFTNTVDRREQVETAKHALLGVTGTRESPRKQVYGDHANTAHVWAQNKIAAGRSSDGRMFFADGVIFSYGRHFPIAAFQNQTFDGRPIVFFTQDRHSTSTSKHTSEARGALHGSDAIVISVPSLRGSIAQAETFDALIDGVVTQRGYVPNQWDNADDLRAQTTQAERALAAFCALFPAFAVPADIDAYVTDREAKRALARAESKRAEFLASLATYARELPRYAPHLAALPDVDGVWRAEERKREFERTAKVAAQALLAFNRAAKENLTTLPLDPPMAIDAKDLAGQARGIKRTLAGKIDELAGLIAALRADETRANRIRELEQLARPIVDDGWKLRGEFTARILSDARELAPALYSTILTRVAQAHARHELDRNFSERNPGAFQITARAAEKRKHASRLSPDDWRAGKGNASYSYQDGTAIYGVHDGSTMVRRVGNELQTSRGARAPWEACVTAFRAAQLCRASGKGWHKNGDRLPVGDFEVDRIDANGNLRAGCHEISWAEMLALAIHEVPHLVKARFPTPAKLSN